MMLCSADEEYDWLSSNDERTFASPSLGVPTFVGMCSFALVYTAPRGLSPEKSSSSSVGDVRAGIAFVPTPSATSEVSPH